MPRYFFDLYINGQVQRDITGRELGDREGASKRANDVVQDLLRIWNQAQALDCACTVHDEQGGHVYRHALVSNAFTPEAVVPSRSARLVEQRPGQRG